MGCSEKTAFYSRSQFKRHMHQETRCVSSGQHSRYYLEHQHISLTSGADRHGLGGAYPQKMSLSPTAKHTGQESGVNCAKLSQILIVSAVKICNQRPPDSLGFTARQMRVSVAATESKSLTHTHIDADSNGN